MFESAYGRDLNLRRTDVQCSCLMLPFQFNIAPSRPWQINLLVLSETFDCDPELSDSELAIKTCSAFNEDLQQVCLTEPIYKRPPRICADLNK